MADIKAEVAELIATTKASDPKLHQALTLINSRLSSLYIELHPLIARGSSTAPSDTDAIDPPMNFTLVSTGATLRFTWSEVLGAFQYEIRAGLEWASATLVTRTTGLRADIDPVTYGNHTYLIKSLSLTNAYSVESSVTNITIPQIPAPVISSSVIDNNALLYWTIPASTFTIAYYILSKNGDELGRLASNFTAIFESIADFYTYMVEAVDIAGNVGTAGSITLQINQPPDFDLQDTFISALDGTKVNTYTENYSGVTKLVCCQVAETWSHHFSANSWDDIGDQIAANYPIYIQPAATTGSYQEIIDYGLTISSIIVTIVYNITQIAGATTVVIKMAVSADNITYSSFVSGASQFYASFRYLKFKLEFTGATDKAVALVSNVTVLLTVKRETDGGEIVADENDTNGTEVFFNKAFKDVESITVAVKATDTGHVAIYDFVDVPNPTSFKIYVFDLAGVRETQTVSWKARGII